MKLILSTVVALAVLTVEQVAARSPNEIKEMFGTVCGDLSRRDCIKNIRSCRRLNTAMSNEISNADDILECTNSMDISIDQIIEAFNKFSNGEGDAPTLESFGVDEGLMKNIRKCILKARGLLDAEGNLDKAAMEASTEAMLNRILGPNQPKLYNAIKNAKQTCGKPTIDTMKQHRDCMNQICVDNI